MPTDLMKLAVLAFPQRWDGARLHVRVLLLPRGNPLEPLYPGASSFADATMQLEARVISGLDHLPLSSDAAITRSFGVTPIADRRVALTDLGKLFPITPPTTPRTRPPGVAVKKWL